MRDAGTQCYHSIPSRLSVIFGIIAVIGITAYVGYIQIQHYKQTEDYCNNQYGVNGWELNETTGTGVNKYYIGQVWECVPLSNSSPDKSGSFNKEKENKMKVPIDWSQLTSKECLRLARRAIKEYNDYNLIHYKII